jgi:homoserine kinase
MLHISVPATSANLGPGFDCLGLAVNLYLEIKAYTSPKDHFFYKGQGSLPDNANNLIHQGFKAAYNNVGKQPPNITFEVNNPIPLARGLGSSSAALVAGVAIADEMLANLLGREGVFELTAALEGHPDNVAPAIYGEFTVSAQREDQSYLCESLEIPGSWQLLFAVPSFELLTSQARAVLPTNYSRADIIYSTSRTALWSLAVAQDKPELLRLASQDVIHEPYRKALIPGFAECKTSIRQAGAYAVFLSGAGPTVGVICSEEVKAKCKKILQGFVKDGVVLELAPSGGYKVRRKEEGDRR